MNMPRITFVFAALMVVLGVGGYVVTGAESPTALIPAAFGAAFAICGLVATRHLQHGMHAAAVFAVLGLLGTARSLTRLPDLLAGSVDRPAAVTAQAIMAVLCVVFIVLCVRSFIEARRAREAGQA